MLNFDLIRVTSVRYVRDHVLWLRFSDGLEGEVDLSDWAPETLHERVLAAHGLAVKSTDGGADLDAERQAPRAIPGLE